jgi:DNA ligase 1
VKRFAQLFTELDETTRTSEKVAAMERYFASADPADAAWAVYFLSGARPKRLVPVRHVATWAMKASDVAGWLFEESYAAVGDLAETIALLLPRAAETVDRPLHRLIEESVLSLAGQSEDVQREIVLRTWRETDGVARFLLNKLITGEFRVGVSRSLVIRALSRVSNLPEAVVAHRLSGAWEPRPEAYQRLVAADTADAHISQPYPFFLAYPLEDELESLGDATEWQAEWKWDGIRAQMIRRSDRSFIWSRGEELVTDRFPELSDAAALLRNGTVIDGEIMPWLEGRPLPFAQLQRRIGRKNLGPRILAEVPVVLLAYDLLEHEGQDTRERPLLWRRRRLEEILGAGGIASRVLLSPIVRATDWSAIRGAYDSARERGAEGLMLKRLDTTYGVGRRRGPWWKWKIEPYAVDAVLVYAQPGHGRRATLYTDYTFAVWNDGELVPFAKAYSGLTDAEIRTLDGWIRRHTVEKFGPVRSVKPEQVFELHFEGIQPSPRHKSGVAVRFPRIARWREDKRADEADSLDTLRALMADR